MIWALLLVFQVKHFLADFPLQNSFMLKKFLPGKEFILPLAAHSAVHAAFTFLIVIMINVDLWWLAVVDFCVHFVVDRIKASPAMLGRFKALASSEFPQLLKQSGGNYFENGRSHIIPTYKVEEAKKKLRHNTYFWLALGADQAAHHLTHYFIIYMLMR